MENTFDDFQEIPTQKVLKNEFFISSPHLKKHGHQRSMENFVILGNKNSDPGIIYEDFSRAQKSQNQNTATKPQKP